MDYAAFIAAFGETCDYVAAVDAEDSPAIMTPADVPPSDESRATYGEILKSTFTIGMSSAVSVGFSIVRMKLLAVLLGPTGVGLFGLYSLVADLAVAVAGMGVQSSGVRQVAESVGSGESARLSRAASVLNAVSLALGIVGALLLAALALPISVLTFGDPLQAWGVALLGVAVFLRLAVGAPIALIQGTRRIGDFARMTIFSAVLNTLVTVPLVFFFGEAGIVPSLIAMALTTYVAALWYRRRIVIAAAPAALPELRREAGALLRLGSAFMVTALFGTGSAYLIRVLIQQQAGVDAAGLYQAAWTIGALYAGFILQAMGTDFYPRLTALAGDHGRFNRLVNEQARIGILLAGPGLLATMTLAPLVMAVLYTAEFQPAVSLLRWLCLGMLLRVVAWPIGYIILAKAANRMMLWAEGASAVVSVALVWLLLPVLGLDGVGVAFVGLYVWHGVLVYVLVRRLSDFRWSLANLRLAGAFLAAGALVFYAESALPFWPGTLIGLAATCVAGLWSLWTMATLMSARSVPAQFRALANRLSLRLGRGGAGPAE